MWGVVVTCYTELEAVHKKKVQLRFLASQTGKLLASAIGTWHKLETVDKDTSPRAEMC